MFDNETQVYQKSSNFFTIHQKHKFFQIAIIIFIFNLIALKCQADLLEDISSFSKFLSPIEANAVEEIAVDISLLPPPKCYTSENRCFVTTGTNFTATANVDSKYNNKNLTYQWSLGDQVILTGPNQTKIVFPRPELTTLKVLVKSENNQIGEYEQNLTVRDPIAIIKTEGKQHIYHDDLFNWTIVFNGTGPFYYCFHLCKAKKSTCDPCHFEPIKLYENTLTIGPLYLPTIDEYILAIYLTNIASEIQPKPITIIVENPVREPKVLYVPIISSILAVLILLVGVAIHLKLRKTVDAETADFDFIRDSSEDQEWTEEQSFKERVMYLLFGSVPGERRSLFGNEPNRSMLRSN